MVPFPELTERRGADRHSQLCDSLVVWELLWARVPAACQTLLPRAIQKQFQSNSHSPSAGEQNNLELNFVKKAPSESYEDDCIEVSAEQRANTATVHVDEDQIESQFELSAENDEVNRNASY